MQKPTQQPEQESPRKPSSRWRLRGILLLLILIAFVILPLVERSNPQMGGLGERLHGLVFSITSSASQQNTPSAALTLPTLTPEGENFSQTVVPPGETPETTIQPVLSPSPEGSVSAANDGWLVLSLLDDNHYHLFAYQPAQQNWMRLTDGEWDDLYPAVSPDGQWISFASNRERYWDIYLLSLVDGRVSPLTRTPHYDGASTWSPDGKWLAYESYVVDPQTQQGNLEIMIQAVNLADSQPQQVVQLTSMSGADFAPKWSPRGRQIAFISQRAGENDLWIADLDRIDDRYRNLSRNSSSSVRAPSWSADGRWLIWNASDEGVQWIYRWDADSPESPPQKVIPGSQPILSSDGKVIFSVFTTPNQSYLQAFSLDDERYQMPLLCLPEAPKGMAWLPVNLLSQASAFQPVSGLQQLFALREEKESAPTGAVVRRRLKELEDVKVPFPYLHEDAFAAFQELRQAVKDLAGWDYLSQLENAYLPISSPSFPSSSEEWLYTGRAIALQTAPMNAGWLMLVKEEYGDTIYWRLYLKTLYQDGSQGMPLRDLPFDLNARYSGDAMAYDRGGASLLAAPSGYWIDLTEVAGRFGWERLPALSTWRTALSTARHSILVKRDHVDWYSAMLELYPAEALYTATPLPSPTQTPTRTAIPTRTSTATPTPRSTATPSIVLTLTQSPTIALTP
ncbi:MAG: hypothetical protein Kow0088_13500 [Anaerolineales bacterium]